VVLAMLAAVPQSRAQQPFVRIQDGFSALFPKPPNEESKNDSVANDKVFMTGKFIVDGKQLYGITLAAARGAEGRVAANRFIQSLKLMPPSPQ
jgi:hypothetical protein